MKYILSIVPCIAIVVVSIPFSAEVRGYPLWCSFLPILGVAIVFFNEIALGGIRD